MEQERASQSPAPAASASVAGRHALVLSGGGARAAYQVGVLRAVKELLPDKTRNPFPILCGTSAGSLNAVALACLAEDFGLGVTKLDLVWGNFHASHVYRADPLGICMSGARWLSSLMFGWLGRHPPRSLLDSAPLRALLTEALDFDRIGRAIASGALYAVSVTASGYVSGESVCFVEGNDSVEMWRRSQRASASVRLNVDHLMASSAIPFIFPATLVNREYFGDGSMRQAAPVSPAIHLGAQRVLVVGAGRMHEPRLPVMDRQANSYPSLAQIAGHTLSSIFLDALAVDVERARRINHTLSLIPPDTRNASGLRPVELLLIAPSQRIDAIAARHAGALPPTVRSLRGGLGANSSTRDSQSAVLASYLLFEPPFTRELMALGRADAAQQRAAIVRFFGWNDPRAPGAAGGEASASPFVERRGDPLRVG